MPARNRQLHCLVNQLFRRLPSKHIYNTDVPLPIHRPHRFPLSAIRYALISIGIGAKGSGAVFFMRKTGRREENPCGRRVLCTLCGYDMRFSFAPVTACAESHAQLSRRDRKCRRSRFPPHRRGQWAAQKPWRLSGSRRGRRCSAELPTDTCSDRHSPL